MRITTHLAYETSISQLQSRQTALTRAQEQLTSGKRVDRASDDPAAAARAERALAAITRADASQRALDTSRHAMALTESALGDAGEMLQQIRELTLSAGRGSLTDADRLTIAASIEGLRKDLLAVANRSDGAGRYLFGGQGSDGPPVVERQPLDPFPPVPPVLPVDERTLVRVVFEGSAGEALGASGEPSPLAVDGARVFMAQPDPDGDLNPLKIFTEIDRLVAGLKVPGQSATETAAVIDLGLGAIDVGMDSLSQWRAHAGEALNRIDGIESRIGQSKLDAQRDRSNAEDLDLIEAISDFQNQQTGYDAALKMFSTVQRMSLFDYLK